MKDTLVSIVTPVFNEEECLPRFLDEVEKVLSETDYLYEIIVVDDGSGDQTPKIIAERSRDCPRIKGVRLSRNSGHQAALSCGLAMAKGDVVITMDGDLQHPPALIPVMLRLWDQDGYDVVNTLKQQTMGAGVIDRTCSKIFYRIFNRVADIKLIPGSADFRLLDRRAVDALNSMGEYFKFFRGQVPYIGFRQTTLAFNCPPRFAGSRSYTLRQSLRLASNGLLSFSTIGLKIPLILGLIILLMVAGYSVVAAFLILTGRTPLIEGWLSLAILLCLSIGLQLTFLGMLGAYVGKIFVEVKRRPLYFVEQTYGFAQGSRRRGGSNSSDEAVRNTVLEMASN